MTDTFTTVEKHEKGDKSGFHTFVNVPNYHQTVSAGQAEFIVGASKALTEFRKQWLNDHPERPHGSSNWLRGIEIDYVPVLSEGMVVGYMVISEIDGESYDYAPAKQIVEEQ